jgi:sigma-70-like protein
VVLSFQGCLGNVPQTERRVLELRAGVGISRARTRAEVARLTGLPRKRVARLEHRGLKRLQSLSDVGSCTAAASATSAGAPIGVAGGLVPPASAGDAPSIGVRGARPTAHSSESKSPNHESAIEAAIDRPIIHGLGHALDLGPLLVAFALGGLCYVVVRELRRTA